MKKTIILAVSCALMVSSAIAQNKTNDERMAWWREARFGMFIHWGVYAVPAGVYKGQRINRIGEWIMNRGKIPVAEYKKFAAEFNPVKYDADAWVRMAKDAGMKYIVITSKHHDGFALFDSKAGAWDIMDATPYKKDLLKPLAEACRRHGLKLGFYYSQAQDWVNPGGAAARRPASEGWANPDSAKIDAYTRANGGHWDPAQTTKTMAQYIDEIAVPQVKEILTNYGDVAVLWWDTPTDMTDEFATKLNELLKLQPNIITNDRLKRPNFPGDFKTPEQRIPNLSELDGKDWETCMTMNETWGYKSWAHNWKSKETLIRNLVDIASKGGNFLLNVGPKADGTIPQESIDLLKQMGEWMKINGESIYDTKASPFGLFSWGRCTSKESNGNTTLYFSVFEWPKNGKLSIPALKNQIISSKLLANGKAVKGSITKDGAVFNLPAQPIDPVATVLKVEVKGNVQVDMANFNNWPPGTSPKEIGKRVADRFVATPHTNFNRPTPPRVITYPETCTWYGALTFAKETGDKKLVQQLAQRFEPLFGARDTLIPKPDHVDYSVFGAVPLELYMQTKDRRYLNLGKGIADKQWGPPEGPRVKPESYDFYNKGLTWQTRMWIDDMFMITAVQAQAFRATNDETYINRAAKEMVVYLDSLQKPNGLFYHAPDVPFFWARGNGWMAVGMSELLRSLPKNNPDYNRIMKGYTLMMSSLLKHQAEDGMWRQLIDDPGSWPETSSTGMFTFAFITGVKNGWLDKNAYAPAARKAWLRLITYLDSNADISEVCEGTNKKNDRQYYLDRKRNIGDLHGQAPVLWCATALLRN